MANKKKKAKAETGPAEEGGGAAIGVLEPGPGDRFPEPRNLNDPDHGTKTRHSDRPEFDDAEKDAGEGWAEEATAIDEAETMASTGDSANSFVEIASGTATGFGIDRGLTTGTGGLAAGEDLDAVAEGDYWRENFETRPYYQAGAAYEKYEPGYRIGWEAANDLQFQGLEFEEVQTELEAQWSTRMGEDAESWEMVQPAARDAWERVRKGVPVPKRGFRREPGDTDRGNRD